MEKKTYKKLKKGLNIVSLVVFAALFIWTLYSPAMMGARAGNFTGDFAWTIYIYFLVTFVLLTLHYLLRMFNSKK